MEILRQKQLRAFGLLSLRFLLYFSTDFLTIRIGYQNLGGQQFFFNKVLKLHWTGLLGRSILLKLFEFVDTSCTVNTLFSLSMWKDIFSFYVKRRFNLSSTLNLMEELLLLSLYNLVSTLSNFTSFDCFSCCCFSACVTLRSHCTKTSFLYL